MRSEDGKRRTVPTAVLAAILGLALCGCAAGGDPGDAEPGGKLLKVDAPLAALAWSGTDESLFGIEDGGRVVKMDPETLTGIEFDGPRPDAVVASQEWDVGGNLALDPRRPGEVYLPQTGPDGVRVVRSADLGETVQTFGVGVAPGRLALDRLSDVLFALSDDGSTVTRVELSGNEVTARRDLTVGPATRIEAPGDGSGALWAAGPEGVALLGGPSLEPVGRLPSASEGLAADAADPDRAYVGRPDGERVLAVEPARKGRLEVVDGAEVGAGTPHLAAEEGRLYVATRDAVTVLDSQNLKTLETLKLERFRENGPLQDVEPSALAVGEDRIYVTLAGEPYVLGLDKP